MLGRRMYVNNHSDKFINRTSDAKGHIHRARMQKIDNRNPSFEYIRRCLQKISYKTSKYEIPQLPIRFNLLDQLPT